MQAGSGTRSHRAPALPSRVQAAFHLRTPAAAAGRRHLVILAARNPFKEAQKDVLPNGSPNTPVSNVDGAKRATSQLPSAQCLRCQSSVVVSCPLVRDVPCSSRTKCLS